MWSVLKGSPVSTRLPKAYLLCLGPPKGWLTYQITTPKVVAVSQEVYNETPEDFEGIASALDAGLHMVLSVGVKVPVPQRLVVES